MMALPLLVIGFLASLVAINTLNPKTVVASGYLIANKTPLYYISHAIQIVTLLAAGVLSWFGLRQSQRRMIALPMAAFFIVSVVFLLRNVGLDEILSTQIASSTGVVPCLLSLLILFGMPEENHNAVDKLVYMSAFGLTAMASLASIRHTFHTRADALANVQGYLIALYVPALRLMFDEPKRLHPVRDLVRFLPITFYAIGSVLTQTRLNLVLLVPALAMYLYVQSKRKSILPSLAGIAVALMIGIAALPILEHTRVGESLEWSKLGLLARLRTDTRSDQIVSYFSDMNAVDLLVGRGQDASYMWVGRWWHGGIDVGYLYLVLCGGIPLLLTYVILHIAPGVRALRYPMDSRQLACAATVVMWGIRMISTGYMDYNPGYYALLFCVGGCLTPRTRSSQISEHGSPGLGGHSKHSGVGSRVELSDAFARERPFRARTRILLPVKPLLSPTTRRRGLPC